MSSWAERKAKLLLVPWNEDTPDAEGFWVYVKEHFYNADRLASEIIDLIGWDVDTNKEVYCVLLDKLTSPLVYLWDSWTVLAPEKKIKYSERLREVHEKNVKMAEEAFKK